MFLTTHGGPGRQAFTTTEAQRAARVTTRQIWHWITQQIIKPSINEAGGAGGMNMWSEEDVAVMAMLGELARLGAEVTVLRQLEPGLREVTRNLRTSRGIEVLLADREGNVLPGRAATVGKLLGSSSSPGFWLLDLRNLFAPRS